MAMPTPTTDQRRSVALSRWRLRRAMLRALDEIKLRDDGGCDCSICMIRFLRENDAAKARHDAKIKLTEVVVAIICNRNKHYLAHSHDCENAVSYARREDMKFLPERRTRTTLGRYIKRNFTDIAISDEFLGQFTSKVMSYLTDASKRFKVIDGAAITRAYRDAIGGGSCMTGDHCDKVEIYAINPDVVKMLVYSDGSMTGRCLVWKTNEGPTVCDRIYPNSGRHVDEFKQYIREKGWHMRENQSFPEGQKFIGAPDKLSVTLSIPDPPIYPYMDSFRCYSRSDVNWTKNTITLHTQTGHAGHDLLSSTDGDGPGYEQEEEEDDDRCDCCVCGSRIHNEDAYYNRNSDCYCSACYHENYRSCERCDCECSNDETTTVNCRSGSQEWCESCSRNYATLCQQCNEYYRDRDGVMVQVEGEFTCSSCAEDAGECHGCCSMFWNDNLTTHSDGESYCSNCLPEEEDDDESDEPAIIGAVADAEAAEVAAAAF